MVENIKLLLGDAAENYSDALINLRYRQYVHMYRLLSYR